MTQTFEIAETQAGETTITIDMLLREFLDASKHSIHKTRPDEREKSIDLLAGYICYHSHKVLPSSSPLQSPPSAPLARSGQSGRPEILTATVLPALVPDFISFLTFEITPVASQRFVRAIGRTLEELIIRLIRQGYISLEEGEEAAYRSAEAGRNLPRAMRALKRLHREVLESKEEQEQCRWSEAGELEHYTIVGLKPGMLWLENENGRVGPIKVSEKVRVDLQTGWQLHCTVAKTGTGWQITGLGGIFPMPA